MPATTTAPVSSRFETTIRPSTIVGDGIGVGVGDEEGVAVGVGEFDALWKGLLQAVRTSATVSMAHGHRRTPFRRT